VSRTALALAAAALSSCAATSAPPHAAEAPGAVRSEIVFYDYRTPDRMVGELSARFDDGSGERAVPPAEFRQREFGFPSSATYSTRSEGAMRVNVSLRHQGQVSEGAFDLPLRPDWRYGIAVHLTGGEAPEGCWGCLGGKAIPLASPIGTATTLFVAWGGNSISRPVVY
jgi:hypothetical protein